MIRVTQNLPSLRSALAMKERLSGRCDNRDCSSAYGRDYGSGTNLDGSSNSRDLPCLNSQHLTRRSGFPAQ